MSGTNLAPASRKPAILALVVGLHVGAFVSVAGGLLPRLLEALPQATVITLLPRAMERDVRLQPVVPRPADYAAPRAPMPEIEIPQDVAAMRASDGAPDASGAPGGDAAAAPHDLFEPPALRMRDGRLAALIDACYPAAARRRGEEGRAVARVVVDPGGGVVRWSLAQGTGSPRLDDALGCVIRRLQFEPGRSDGAVVTAEVLLPVAFRLN
jgi:protein TonB